MAGYDWTDWDDESEGFTWEGWLALGGNYPSWEGADVPEPWQPRSVLDPLDGAQFDHAMFGHDSEWTGLDPFDDASVGAAEPTADAMNRFAAFQQRRPESPFSKEKWVEYGLGGLVGVLLAKVLL